MATDTTSTANRSLAVPKILQYTSIRTKRGLYNYLTATLFFFVFTILATSIVKFLIIALTETSQNGTVTFNQDAGLFWAGILLGTVSLSALIVDPLIAWLQKRVRQKTLMLVALAGLMGTVGIFLFSFIPALQWVVFVIFAAFLYGWSFDMYDVTMTQTILRDVSRKNYSQNISQKRLAEVIGMMLGLLCSGFILYFGDQVALVILFLTFIVLFVFVMRNFDNENYDQVELVFGKKTDKSQLRSILQMVANPSDIGDQLSGFASNIQHEAIELSKRTQAALATLPEKATVATAEVLEQARLKLIDILSKDEEKRNEARADDPEAPEEEEEVSRESAKEGVKKMVALFVGFFLHPKGREVIMMWVAVVIIFFSFWDTMAVTFQPLFFEELAQTNPTIRLWSGFIMAGFIVPILILQVPASKLADKMGKRYFITAGVALSGVSLLMMGLFESLFAIVIAGLLNSVGYALAFASAQGAFLDYAQDILSEEDRSSAPGIMRIALNLGNIVGQMAGGIVFALLGFQVGFLSFGVLLVGYTGFSIYLLLKRRDLFPQKPPKATPGQHAQLEARAGATDDGPTSSAGSPTTQEAGPTAG